MSLLTGCSSPLLSFPLLSSLEVRWAPLSAAVVLAASAALSAQNVVFSTHDQTLSIPAIERLFNEAWADVKAPGGFPTTNVGLPPLGFPVGFPATLDAAILVSRPSSLAVNIAAGVLQFGFPPALPNAVPTGCEIWLGGGVFATFPALAANQAFRLPLAPIPGGTGPISAQMVCLHFAPIVGAFPGCASLWTASPVLTFSL